MAKASAKRPILPLPLWMGVSCGIAVGLIVMMLPVALLESLVEQTGLASVLPAAAPPLGQTARGLLAAIAGLVMAVSCFTLLRALEGLPPVRIGKRRPRRDAAEAIFDAAQPDDLPEPALIEEPRRGPIMAARDLGAPFHSITAETAQAAALPDLTSDSAPEAEAPLVLEPEMAEAAIEVAPESDTEAPALDHVEQAVPAPDPVPEADGAMPIPVSPARDAIEGSIPSLVRRLETGFERRLAGREAGQPEPGFADPQPDIDVALRDALGTLQRMSARSR
ncbi:hypothetical protein [Sphingomonas colocasiae]|uniref:Uncharacterized protein n=1 Tax=Sphingomonas colocasiae TaxID=1848973 RepID=A0ABS7PWQ4_9SPHN|nr:hypothetical protein [Sphingomonas colocasiae]MBY8825790.1 hypothetical protein [Sphingomonas colocasiae]